ncbi:MAG: phage exclusion protein Lit family protein [Anaerolineaceae bacterium]
MSSEDIILMLMKAATPERVNEIDTLWARYNPKVVVVEDNTGITLNANRDRIEFDPKSMAVFWLIGFSGWKAIECYSPHVILSGSSQRTLQELFDDDVGLPELELTYKERLAMARSLIEHRDADAIPWPDDLPRPVSNRDALEGNQHKATFDLVLFSLAFAFLHEFRHVMLDFDCERPSELREEELHCDVWARNFMITKLESYALNHGHDYQAVLRKRSMGIGLAALILHEITPKHGFNLHYFSIKTRLTTLLCETKLPDNDSFWVFTASILVGIFRREHYAFTAPPMSARMLAEHLINQLPE